MKFFAIDVETANPSMTSICSIGLAKFENSALVGEWYTLINPEDYFSPINTEIHNISEDMVSNAPTFAQWYGFLSKTLHNEVVVTHTHFDKSALRQASELNDMPDLCCHWLDSAKIVRRTWKELSKSGYGLSNACKFIGYEFEHHHALEDAKAAGQIVIASMAKLNMSIEDLLERTQQPIQPRDDNTKQKSVKRDGNPDGPLFGEKVVFTGALSMTRQDAANLASEMGCHVATTITKDTTLLVAGDIDVNYRTTAKLSSKHKKAIELQLSGVDLKIISESDFIKLLQNS